MKTLPRSIANVLGLLVLISLVGLSEGCRRPRGLPSAADSGTKAVDESQQSTANATTPSTGTDSTGRPSGASGGTTGTDPAESATRAGAGGGATASTAADNSNEQAAKKSQP